MLKTMDQTARAQALAPARDAALVEGRIEERRWRPAGKGAV